MTSDTVKLDDEGVPILENPVSLDQITTETRPDIPDISDHDVVAALLRHTSVQDLLQDMSEDLQKLVAWKIEELLKERINLMIAQAFEDCAPKLVEDIHTQLQLALPGLLTNLVEQARDIDPEKS